MVLTGLQNCQSTDGHLEQNGEKLRINSLNRAYFKRIAIFKEPQVVFILNTLIFDILVIQSSNNELFLNKHVQLVLVQPSKWKTAR